MWHCAIWTSASSKRALQKVSSTQMPWGLTKCSCLDRWLHKARKEQKIVGPMTNFRHVTDQHPKKGPPSWWESLRPKLWFILRWTPAGPMSGHISPTHPTSSSSSPAKTETAELSFFDSFWHIFWAHFMFGYRLHFNIDRVWHGTATSCSKKEASCLPEAPKVYTDVYSISLCTYLFVATSYKCLAWLGLCRAWSFSSSHSQQVTYSMLPWWMVFAPKIGTPHLVSKLLAEGVGPSDGYFGLWRTKTPRLRWKGMLKWAMKTRSN